MFEKRKQIFTFDLFGGHRSSGKCREGGKHINVCSGKIEIAIGSDVPVPADKEGDPHAPLLGTPLQPFHSRVETADGGSVEPDSQLLTRTP